jgi:hypothetical protein
MTARGIISNPVLRRLPQLPRPAPRIDSADANKRDHDALAGVYGALLVLLGAEYHEELVDSVASTRIAHGLRRKPETMISTAPPDGHAFVYVPDPGIDGLWTDTHVVLQASSGTPTVRFLLL